ncbi:phosphoglucomutase/phosphomannomutase family protein [Tumebacillus lipolyticus]|uniref:Phosphoglucomutase n=1 Tax=Tumebacillus lipolyticus TaxID=1280370 RepID=A0ABW4ZUA3_9BACL
MDIQFGTEGWRGQIADTFTTGNLRLVCQAIADELHAKQVQESGVVVGYDTRFLSDVFARECAQVLAANSIPVYLFDSVTPTPLLSFAVRHLGAAGGLMITASHNPAVWNGVKWKGPHAGPANEEEIAQIAARLGKTAAKSIPFDSAKRLGMIELINLDQPYFDQLLRFLSPTLDRELRLHVVVDAMHGAAGAYFSRALEALGCQVTQVRSDPDPTFGGVNPEPIPKNLGVLMEKVLEVGADLGLATDGDGDRLGAVDAQGNYVSPQILFALLTLHLLRDRKWSGSVVKTFSTTWLIDRIADLYEVQMHEVPIGFKHICGLMQAEDVLIGGEESGGIGIPLHMPERDGIFSGMLLIEHLLLSGQQLSDAIDQLMFLAGYHAYDRIDLPLAQAKKESLFRSLVQQPITFAGDQIEEVQTLDGVKYKLSDGRWILFRASGTEPLLRIYAEARESEDVSRLIAAAKRLVD